MKNKKNVVIKKGCHSQVFLLGISHIRFRKWTGLFKQAEDPRQNSSGMTLLFNTGGFTLIELLVVVLIIGILAAVAVPQYNKAVLKARLAEYEVNLKTLALATKACNLAKGANCSIDELDIEVPECKPLPGIFDECVYTVYNNRYTKEQFISIASDDSQSASLYFEYVAYPGTGDCNNEIGLYARYTLNNTSRQKLGFTKSKCSGQKYMRP